MKIRFTSIRSAPDIDQGIKVPYAPPKRQAFRLRWYLILLLVSSPLLYAAWRMLASLWLIEAPGYIELPVYQIVAPQSSDVATVLVSDNQHVRKGQTLVELRRPELEARLQTLRKRLSSQPASTTSPASHGGQQLPLLRESLASYQRLFNAGAATRGELDAARLRLQDAETALRQPQQSSADERERRDWQAELGEAEAARKSLLLRAPCDATVLRLETLPGLSVQAGQTLLTLQQDATPRIVALLPPRYADYARAGQTAWVSWSSGEKAEARVLYNGTVSERVPDALRGFGDLHQGILVQLELLNRPPARLKVNNISVNVRFPRDLGF